MPEEILIKNRQRYKQTLHKRRFINGHLIMKGWSVSPVIREVQIKPQWDTISRSWEWLKWKRLAIPSVGENVDQLELSKHCWQECKMVQLLLKPVWLFSSKAKHAVQLCYNTAGPPLGIYPREMKSYVHRKIRT